MEQTLNVTRLMSHADFIVERLRRLREARGMSVAELARRSEMDESHLGKVFRGERQLKADEYLKLCYSLGAPNEQFIPVDVKQELADLNSRTMDGHIRL